MRVAVVHSYYSSSVPSGENIAVNLQVDALRAAGNDVLLVSRSTDDVAHRRGSTIRAAATVTTGLGPSPLPQLAAFDPDVVHVHNLFPNFGTSWIRECSAPIVATLHNFRAFCSAGTLWRDGHDCEDCLATSSFRAVVHRCYRHSSLASMPLAVATRDRGRVNPVLSHAAALVTLAPRSRSTFARARPDLRERLRVVPNFTPDDGRASAPRAHAPWLFVGRLETGKGIDGLIDQWPSSEELTVVGSGPLERELKSSAVRKPIHFVGQVHHEQIARMLAGCRALVFPSRWHESAPALTYVEALAAGRPTLAIGANTVADDVATARSGVAISDFAALAGGMAALNGGLAGMATAARRRFEEEYSETSWLRRISDVYESVVMSR
jgi:glycosyltransferase involved in cell wall biosynthesis